MSRITLIYEEEVRLNQYVIIDNDEKVDVIRNWFKEYTEPDLFDL